MNDLAILVDDAPASEDVALLEQRLDEHNIEHTGLTDAQTLSIIVRDACGEIVAGLHGWTWGGSSEIKTLWIHEDMRGRGLGTRLMQAAEMEARSRGATQMVLSTHSFQAPEFYVRRGFTEIGRIDAHPNGHSSIYLRKSL